MGLKVNNETFGVYYEVFTVVWSRLLKMFPTSIADGSSPVIVLDNMKQQSDALANRGLSEGLRDMVFMVKNSPPGVVKEIEAELHEKGLPSLRYIQAKMNNTVQKVIKSKKIKSENDYYTIKEYLDDLTTDLSDEQRSILSVCLEQYEHRA